MHVHQNCKHAPRLKAKDTASESMHIPRASVHVDVQASTGIWTRACHSASQHKGHARGHAVLHASTRHMHACTPFCMPARGTCTPAHRSSRQHKAHARLQRGVLACTHLNHSCSA